MSWQRSSGYNRRSLVETESDVSLQDRRRLTTSRTDSAQSTDRGKSRVRRAKPDDRSGHAGLRPDPLTRKPRGEKHNRRSIRAPTRMWWAPVNAFRVRLLGSGRVQQTLRQHSQHFGNYEWQNIGRQQIPKAGVPKAAIFEERQ